MKRRVKVNEQRSGERPAGILADSGYCSEKNLEYLAATGQSGHPIEAYIATGKQQHDAYGQPCPPGPLPRNATHAQRINHTLPPTPPPPPPPPPSPHATPPSSPHPPSH